MFEFITDIKIVNDFLMKFGQSIIKFDDPFKKYLAYKMDNKIVGFVNFSLIYDRIEIEYIYTLENYRNRNIASNLLDYIYDIGIKKHCLNITLEVKKSNIPAIKFYEKNGFKQVSVRKNYYNDEDGILMIRELV